MSLNVNISAITGTSPYDIYICDVSGVDCYYVDTISNVPYYFQIYSPFDNFDAYLLKIIDSNDCIISGITYVISPTPTPTTTVTPTPTPTLCIDCPTPTPTATPTKTPVILYSYPNSGRGNSEIEACEDGYSNSRTFYSNCDSSTLGAGCYVYIDTNYTLLLGFGYIVMNGINWDIDPLTGEILNISTTQC